MLTLRNAVSFPIAFPQANTLLIVDRAQFGMALYRGGRVALDGRM